MANLILPSKSLVLPRSLSKQRGFLSPAQIGIWSATGVAGPFDPASLFLSGEKGGWWEPSDDATVWADSGRTTPAGDGVAIYHLDDKSGNGYHVSQATSANRPIRNLVGSVWHMAFDGTNDSLVVGANDIFRNIQYGLVVAGVVDDSGTDTLTRRLVHLELSAAARTFCSLWNSTGQNAEIVGRRVAADGASVVQIHTGQFLAGAVYVAHIRFADGRVDVYRNGTKLVDNVVYGSAGTTANAASSLSFTLGSNREGGVHGQFFNGDLGPVLINGRNTPYTAAEISGCNTYFGGLL